MRLGLVDMPEVFIWVSLATLAVPKDSSISQFCSLAVLGKLGLECLSLHVTAYGTTKAGFEDHVHAQRRVLSSPLVSLLDGGRGRAGLLHPQQSGTMLPDKPPTAKGDIGHLH